MTVLQNLIYSNYVDQLLLIFFLLVPSFSRNHQIEFIPLQDFTILHFVDLLCHTLSITKIIWLQLDLYLSST